MSVELSHIRIVGSGLIGTSIGLAAVAQGVAVDMVDSNPRTEALARDLIASPQSEAPVDLVVIATPISALSTVIEKEFLLNPHSSFMDIASVKNKAVAEVKASKLPLSQFLPTHPMAGREVAGVESAQADLFIDRPWIIDSSSASDLTLARGLALIELCGASVFTMESGEHDQAVALISHMPQLVSSLLASSLTDADPSWLALSGAGLRDTTRIAASNPLLWREIVANNSKALTPLLTSLHHKLGELIPHLQDEGTIERFIAAGNAGRAQIPGKHGGAARTYTILPIVIDDKPGQLAALFQLCDEAKVNVEDVSIEHSPGQETGLVLLSLSSGDAEVLATHLASLGWSVHSPR